MDVNLTENDGRLAIRIDCSELVERRFLRQLMEHGASVTMDDSNNYETVIKVTGNTLEDAELSSLDKMLET